MKSKIVIWGLLLVLIASGFAGFAMHQTQENYPVTRDSNSGLIAYWDFDEGSGNILHDKSGNGNDGIIHGATWTTGVKGYALYFDGVNDYVDCGNHISLAGYSLPLTLVAWVYKEEGGGYNNGGFDGIITLDKYTNYAGATLDLHALVRNKFEVGVEFGDDTGVDQLSRHSKTTEPILSMNTWHLVVGVIRSAYNMRIYIDGEEVYGTYSGEGDGIVWTGGHTILGNSWGKYNYFFKGKIDEVRIYDRALSAEEISELYHQIVPEKNPGMGNLWLWIGVITAIVIATVAIVVALTRRNKPAGTAYGYPPQQPYQPPQATGMITVTCPYCGFTSQVPANMRGQWVKCPNCGNQFQVP